MSTCRCTECSTCLISCTGPAPPPPSSTPAIEWVATTPAGAHSLKNAVVAGHEPCNCSPLWVIRAKHEGGLVPGKLAIKHTKAYVPWNSKEHAVSDIEVCCARPGSITWVGASKGNFPPNAVVGGYTACGETLYVARASHDGSLTPGKVHPSQKVMFMSYGGNELHFQNYEVLCAVGNTY